MSSVLSTVYINLSLRNELQGASLTDPNIIKYSEETALLTADDYAGITWKRLPGF